MAIEAANYLNTPMGDVETLFPLTNRCENCSIPTQWASPLTCEWLHQIPTKTAETQMLELAGLTHRWLGTFLDADSRLTVPTKPLLNERASLRFRIECFEPVAANSYTEVDAMTECCRWASLILLAVERLSSPIYMVAKQVRIQPRLIRRLRMTDLSNCWGIRRGLLFWVAATCHFSIAGQCFPLLSTTVFARLAQELAMSDCCTEIAIKPLRRLKLFESLCCLPKPTS
jgi:hypothetical protein